MFLDQLTNQGGVAERDGREYMVARATLQEQRHDCRWIVAGLAVNSSPADDAELMHVAGALDVAASIEQCANNLEILPGGSPVQRAGVVSSLACIWVRAMF